MCVMMFISSITVVISISGTALTGKPMRFFVRSDSVSQKMQCLVGVTYNGSCTRVLSFPLIEFPTVCDPVPLIEVPTVCDPVSPP
jgi:hypothetical protein